MDVYDARRLMQDAKARAELYKILWKAAHADEAGRMFPGTPPDEQVKKELRRILFPNFGWTVLFIVLQICGGLYLIILIATIIASKLTGS